MKIKGMLFLMLFFAACKVNKIESDNRLKYALYDNYDFTGSSSKGSSDITVAYKGSDKGFFEFMCSIKNSSTDTLLIEPSKFYYLTVKDSTREFDKFFCVETEEILSGLIEKRDSLSKMKNPYSNESKKVKELITESLVSGAITKALGVKSEDIEEQRKQNEDNWDEAHRNDINIIDKKISFWESKALGQTKVLPNAQTSGLIVFPKSNDAETITLYLPVGKELNVFNFKKVK